MPAGPVWVRCRVVAEFSETLGAALLEVGLIVGFEPVVDEAASASKRCFQGRGVVPAAQPPMPLVGGADLWQGVQSVLLGGRSAIGCGAGRCGRGWPRVG